MPHGLLDTLEYYVLFCCLLLLYSRTDMRLIRVNTTTLMHATYTHTHADRCTQAQHRRGTKSTHAWRDAAREIPPLMHLALESDGQAPYEVRFQPTHPNPTLNMRTTCTSECTCPNFFFSVSRYPRHGFLFFFFLSHCIFYKKLWEWGTTIAPQNAHGNSRYAPHRGCPTPHANRA